MKRRIVLGSSAAAQILNEDIGKLNKYKAEAGESLKEPDNRSTRRFLKLNELSSAKPESCQISDQEYDKITSRNINALKLLDKIFDDGLESVLTNPRKHYLIKEIIPDITDDAIEDMCDYYFMYYNRKGKPFTIFTPKSTSSMPKLNIRKIKMRRSSQPSRENSPILEQSQESSPDSKSKKVKKEKVDDKPSDLEIMEIIRQLNLDSNMLHLIGEIEELVEKFAENDAYSWKFRSLKGQNYWVNRHTNTSRPDYPYMFTLRSEVIQLFHKKGLVQKRSSSQLNIDIESNDKKSQIGVKSSEDDLHSQFGDNSRSYGRRSSRKYEKHVNKLLLDGQELVPELPDTRFCLSKYQIARMLGLQGQEDIVNYIDQQRNQISKMF